MPGPGIEPGWGFPLRILSPLRLPVSPPAHAALRGKSANLPRKESLFYGVPPPRLIRMLKELLYRLAVPARERIRMKILLVNPGQLAVLFAKLYTPAVIEAKVANADYPAAKARADDL